MRFYIIIPAHNEEDSIGLTLESLAKQTYLPKKIVVVNDNSTDNTKSIIEQFASNYKWIKLINTTSSENHLPGTKVINAFYKGFESLDNDFDIICKFDADIILPDDYIEGIKRLFENNSTVGIAGGLAYIKKNGVWTYENIANKNHVRGPIKAYRKACFKDIGGLKRSIGWDTVDTLLAQYYNWTIAIDERLQVKHLKPTGINYNKSSKYLQGEALYKMRYGFTIALITALKISYKKKSLAIFKNYIVGFFRAKKQQLDFLVSEEEGRFIRQLRWKGIKNKL